MEYGLISCIPILVLITGALITKKTERTSCVSDRSYGTIPLCFDTVFQQDIG